MALEGLEYNNDDEYTGMKVVVAGLPKLSTSLMRDSLDFGNNTHNIKVQGFIIIIVKIHGKR